MCIHVTCLRTSQSSQCGSLLMRCYSQRAGELTARSNWTRLEFWQTRRRCSYPAVVADMSSKGQALSGRPLATWKGFNPLRQSNLFRCIVKLGTFKNLHSRFTLYHDPGDKLTFQCLLDQRITQLAGTILKIQG